MELFPMLYFFRGKYSTLLPLWKSNVQFGHFHLRVA